MSGIGIWQAAMSVSTGVGLVAFIVAVVGVLSTRRMDRDERLISLANPEQRVKLIEIALRKYGINTDNLSPEEQAKQYRLRTKTDYKKFKLVLQFAGLVIIAATLVVFYAKKQDPCARPFMERSLDCPNLLEE